MADPQVFALPVEIERGEAIATLTELLEDVPDASLSYAQRHNNPQLPSSPAALLEAAGVDHGVREVYGTPILVGALVRVVANQQRHIEELEALSGQKPKPTTKK